MEDLLTPAEMARVDAAAIAGGIPGIDLMQAAGRAVARAAMRRFRPVRTLVLAGPGNNGGDGWVAARLLEAAGWPVSVAALAPPRPGSDASLAAAAWRGPVVPFSVAETARAGLVVDAVFGAGLSKPVEGLAAEVLASLRAPVLAVDVPSGVDGETGQVVGVAPQAALTVTFFRRKPGHLLLPGRELCGELLLAQIGLPADVLPGIFPPGAPRAWRNGPWLWRIPRPGAASHKYARGHVAVAAGAGMTGAARLAAAGARRAGAGLVSIAAPDAATAAVLRGGEPGVMVAEGRDALLADPRIGTWVIGPGLPPGDATAALLRAAVGAGRQVVADAGALRCDPAALAGAAILTPHGGEFAALFGPPGPDRPRAVRDAARRAGAVVVLKGADTLVAAPDGRLAVNDGAPPWLATGGTGDVLAGIAAALLAQGLPAFEAAAAAVHLHGAAARLAGLGLLAEDLPRNVARALARLWLD
jgi:hydroxyethylthiazole kinase-like uncharacterized protein yjeF